MNQAGRNLDCAPAMEQRVISERMSNGIDLLRGLFAILVLISHAIGSYEREFSESTENPIFQSIVSALSAGSIWVYGFFVLSGFCIHLSVNNLIAKGKYSHRNYLLARITRIYPLFFVGLLLALATSIFVDLVRDGESLSTALSELSGARIIATLLMLQNFHLVIPEYGPSWSITNEWLYYLVWPVCLALGLYRGNRALIWSVLIAMGITGVAAVCYKLGVGPGDGRLFVPFWTIFFSMLAWIAGVACLVYLPQLLQIVRQYGAIVLLIFVLSFSALYLIRYYYLMKGAPALVMYPIEVAAAVSFALGILLLDRVPLTGPAVTRICGYLGSLSYPLYLFHDQILRSIRAVYDATAQSWNPYLAVAFAVMVCLIISGTIGVYLENSIMSWRKRFLKKHSNYTGSTHETAIAGRGELTSAKPSEPEGGEISAGERARAEGGAGT